EHKCGRLERQRPRVSNQAMQGCAKEKEGQKGEKSKERAAVLSVSPRGGVYAKRPERDRSDGALCRPSVFGLEGYTHAPTSIVSGGRGQEPGDFICAFSCLNGTPCTFGPLVLALAHGLPRAPGFPWIGFLFWHRAPIPCA